VFLFAWQGSEQMCVCWIYRVGICEGGGEFERNVGSSYMEMLTTVCAG